MIYHMPKKTEQLVCDLSDVEGQSVWRGRFWDEVQSVPSWNRSEFLTRSAPDEIRTQNLTMSPFSLCAWALANIKDRGLKIYLYGLSTSRKDFN